MNGSVRPFKKCKPQFYVFYMTNQWRTCTWLRLYDNETTRRESVKQLPFENEGEGESISLDKLIPVYQQKPNKRIRMVYKRQTIMSIFPLKLCRKDVSIIAL